MVTMPESKNMMTRLCWISHQRIFLHLFHPKDGQCPLIYPLLSLLPNAPGLKRLMMRRLVDVVDGFRNMMVLQRSLERVIPCLTSSDRNKRPCANFLLHHLQMRKNGNWCDG